jgi:hypothetical protein
MAYPDGREIRFGDFVRFERPSSPPAEGYVLGELESSARLLLQVDKDQPPKPIEASHCALKSRGYEWMIEDARNKYLAEHPGGLKPTRVLTPLDHSLDALDTIRQAILAVAPAVPLPPPSSDVAQEASNLAVAIRASANPATHGTAPPSPR